MKLNVCNTPHGLVPCYDCDFDEKKKLKLGQYYSVEVKLLRNYEFHKKYFALINLSWDYLTEKQQEFFKDKDKFRKTIEMTAGYCDTIYSIKRKEWIDVPLSISFDKLDEAGFSELYERVKDVLFMTALKHVSFEEFQKNLANF